MKSQNLLRILILALVASLGLNACAAPAAPTEPPAPAVVQTEPAVQTEAPATEPAAVEEIVLTDGLNRQVTLPAPAQRIISLAPSNTEILFAIGAGNQVVGRDELSDFPAEAKEIPPVGSSFTGLNNEAILNLKPDLLLATGVNTPEQVKEFEDLGLTVYYLPNPVELEDMYQNLLVTGQLTGHEDEAASLVETLKGRVEAVVGKTAPVSALPKVFYELDSTDPNAPYTAGAGTFIDTLIQMAGGQNVGSVLESEYGQLSTEELLVQNPDLILLGDAAYGVTVESVGQRAGWEELDAVKNGQVYAFDDNLISRPGPRLVDALEELAKRIHPELFE
jgi:iron complex transport system substrate-binding protein